MLPSLENRSLRAVLPAVFALIFAIPLLIFFSVAVSHEILGEQSVQYAIVFYIAVSLLGYVILRGLVDRIIAVADAAAQAAGDTEEGTEGANELHSLSKRFEKLMKRLDSSTSDLEQRILELAALREISETATRFTDTASLFDAVLAKTVSVSRSHAGAVLTQSAENETFRLEAARGIGGHHTIGEQFEPQDCPAFRAVTENRTIQSVSGASAGTVIDRLFDGGHMLACPLRGRDNIAGLIAISRLPEDPPYRDYEAGYVETILGTVAFAVDNARLIENMRAAHDELKHLQEKMMDLERAAAVNQTVVTLSDRINNPLTVIRGSADIIRKHAGDGDGRVIKSLEAIDDSVARCVDIMDKLQNLTAVRTRDYAGSDVLMIDVEDTGKNGGGATGDNEPSA